MPPHTQPLRSDSVFGLLMGRDRERAFLRDRLAACLAGQGSLVLISGEAGIGKTALAEALCQEAVEQGASAAVGRCYDLTETPPYGPWAELLASTASEPPDLGGTTLPASRTALFAQVRDYLATHAMRQPLVLLLEDLHWADPASLDLLRALARVLGTLPLLILATYRPEDLTREHPLYALLPALMRETRPLRLDLWPLDEDDTRMLVTARYLLPAHDVTRLARWLQAHAEGNPFYAGELLRGLEEEGLLRSVGSGWALDELTRASLPPLLRQVIDGRIARLGAEAQRALAVAAVIGQEVPLALWAAVSQMTADILSAVMTGAEAARLLSVTGDGAAVRFAHALIREALYAGTPTVQRRAWHRLAGGTLASLPSPDPDTVAYHLQQAGDPDAIAWLLRAAERAERAYAWGIAADRYTTALTLLERRGADPAERGWLAYRIAALSRYRDPRGSLTILEDATRLATDASDQVLAACVLFLRGNLHCYIGEFRPGLAAMAAGTAAHDALTDEERVRVRALGSVGGFVPDARQQRATLAMRLAGTGRFTEAREIGEALVRAQASTWEAGAMGDLADANASRGLAVAYAALGRPDEARHAFARARAIFEQIGDHFHIGVAAMQELQWVTLPYRTDRPAEWEHLATEAERAWTRAGDAPADLPRGFARLPLLLLTGEWVAARALALAVHTGGGSYKATASRALGMLAREQGDVPLAQRLIQDELPAGPDTPVGTANFSTALLLQHLAVTLALDTGNLDEARAWLSAHDDWLAWSGSVLGQADRHFGWASYYRATGEDGCARTHAVHALDYAREPRQPLTLIAAHRLLCELDILAGEHADAEAHGQEALTLAAACGAPYERALTLLALAELRLATGERAAARPLVDEAHGICTLLAARPALARADALTARLPQERPSPRTHPAGLSAREAEILGLVAAGESNREIADALSLSVRTVEKHVAHIYAKVGARGRADAAAYAVRHGLLPEATNRP